MTQPYSQIPLDSFVQSRQICLILHNYSQAGVSFFSNIFLQLVAILFHANSFWVFHYCPSAQTLRSFLPSVKLSSRVMAGNNFDRLTDHTDCTKKTYRIGCAISQKIRSGQSTSTPLTSTSRMRIEISYGSAFRWFVMGKNNPALMIHSRKAARLQQSNQTNLSIHYIGQLSEALSNLRGKMRYENFRYYQVLPYRTIHHNDFHSSCPPLCSKSWAVRFPNSIFYISSKLTKNPGNSSCF